MAKSKKQKPGTGLTTFLSGATLPALAADEMASALQTDAAQSSSGGGAFEFLTFSGKQGTYKLGRSNDEIDPESLFVVDPSAMRRGWVCWVGGKVKERVSWSVYEAHKAIDEDELNDHGPYNDKRGDGWSTERTMFMRMLDEDRQVSFSTTSKSGNNVFADLNGSIAGQVAAGGDHIPIISLQDEEFTAQEMTNFKPVITIEGWTNMQAVQMYLIGELSIDDLLQREPPKKKRKAVKRKRAA